MNRGIACLLFSVVTALGCGARTGTLDLGSSGPNATAGAGSGGAPNVAGAPSFGGAPLSAGAPSFGGAPPSAGAPSFGGAPAFAGSPSFGGAPFGGFPNFGGSPSFAGSPSGGFPSFGGAAGSGGEGGAIVNACVAIANNDCDKCLCSVCSSQVVSCFSDQQCGNIFGCIVQKGCFGAGCYRPDTCEKVIDDNGGLFSPAVGEVFTLVACAAQSQGNCGCN